MKTSYPTSRRTTLARAAAALLAVTFIHPLWAAPGDITQVPAPALGADPPKARDIADGDASVSTQTGAFNYSYPIAVPPGRLGMQPSLALTYSSQGANYGGIAAGWSLSIPEIALDTSYSSMRTTLVDGVWVTDGPHVSTLAGGRPLVAVQETALPDVAQTFRARNDSTWARYEKMSPGVGYNWRVRTPDGVTHYFGETALAPNTSERWAPLTRTVDSFGNTIEYVWQGWQISQIKYTSNPGAGLPSFARVEFVWETGFACDGRPVGAQSDRKLELTRGEKQLAKIRAVAFQPGAPGTPLHTREITLAYSASHAACNEKRAPMRVLQSIQESAWGAQALRVDLPAVTFEYNRFERGFGSSPAQHAGTLWPEDSRPSNLGWGYRRQGALWPSVESMMLDFDGDGLQDRVFMYPDPAAPNECAFVWRKNLGRQADDTIRFADVSVREYLPRLPWASSSKSSTEWCSLSAQFTMKATEVVSQQSPCAVNNGSYLAYRWLDMNGDKLPDLVTAIHHDSRHLDPDDLQVWPSCTPEPACPAVSAECFDQAVECPGPDQTCVLDDGQTNICLDQSPRVPCGWIGMRTPPAAENTCHETFTGLSGFGCSGTDRIEPPEPDGVRCTDKKAHTKCDRYPWTIYENLGGHLSSQGQIKYQPLPLESDAGDSSFGGGSMMSGRSALIDIDGDGALDAVIRGGYSEQDLTVDYHNHIWLVFPGDGNGGFLAGAQSWPHSWAVPDGAPVSWSCSSEVGGLCSPYQHLYEPSLHLDDLDVRGLSTLVDLNGDGALDLVWKIGADQFTSGNSLPSLGAVQEADPIVAFDGNGRQFEYRLSNSIPVGRALGPSDATYISRSEVDDSVRLSNHFMSEGIRRTKARFVDVDEDGRVDLVESSWNGTAWGSTSVFINHDGTLLPGIGLGGSLPDRWGQETEASDTGFQYVWETKKDVADLDGDGISEAWAFVGNGIAVHRDVDHQPMHLMSHITNGRGATVDVLYAPTTDGTVVQQNAGLTQNGERHAMPSVQWVVRSMSVSDAWDTTGEDTSTTSYGYTNPVWKPDDQGRWGFRGFETVTTTRPSGARQVDTHGFDVDWSGRLKSTRVYDATDLANPRTISETTWQQKLLFGNALKTYHVEHEKRWTCSNGQSEAMCKAATDNCVTTRYIYDHLPATGTPQLYYANQIYTLGGNYTAYLPGDRRVLKTEVLYSDADDYQLKETFSGQLQLNSSSPWQETWFSYALSGYDAAYKAQIYGDVYFTLAPSYQRAVTTWEYDWTTGALLWKRSPRNYPNGPVESYTYDATKRFATTVANEALQMVYRTYEPGTGALLTEQGPSASSCGAGCTNWEQHWTDIDGLGRPLATYVNVPMGSNPVWQKTKVSRTAYTDSVIGGARTKVVAEGLLEWEVDRWTREETRLDGQARPVEIIVESGSTSPDAVTTFDYDHRGHVVAVYLPDPSQNTTSTVKYGYDYDSLGRPTSMRRPTVGGPDASGVNLTYNGLVHDRQEVAGSQGGPEARTQLVHDRFGRLTEVREYTDSSTFASTTYQYDAKDAVRRIQNADGVVTELTHDMGGRRVSILRAGKTWTYGYNAEGSMASEAAPAPAGLGAAYTTTYAYDVLGRPSSRVVGVREMNTADQQLFGIGTVKFAHDSCANGAGRLCRVEYPHGVLETQYTYDAEGNAAGESRTFNFAGVSGTRGTSAVFGPGGRVVEQTYADNPIGSTDATRAKFIYDDRGLPQVVRWVRPGLPGALTVASQTRNTAGLVTSRSTGFLVPGWLEHTSAWTYDPLTRVLSQTITDSNAKQLAKQELGYFGNDDPERLQHSLEGSFYDFSFLYDQRHQLTDVDESGGHFAAEYAFTPAGKLSRVEISRTATPAPGADVVPRSVDYQYASPSDPEAVSALVPVGGGAAFRSYSYDTVGSMTARSGVGAPTDAFVYDGDDQLRRATVASAGASTAEEYFYDHGGKRTAVVSRSTTNAVTAVRVFLGDSEVVLTPAGALDKTYAHLSLGTPVARISNRTDVELQYQGLASNTLLSIKPDGDVQSGFVYAPYGELLEATGSSVAEQHRRFNDKLRDNATSLAYYGVRYYDGVLLGWTQSDPLYRFVPDRDLSVPRTALLYAFTAHNPLALIDPDGRGWRDIAADVVQVAGTVAGAAVGCATTVWGGCVGGAVAGGAIGGAAAYSAATIVRDGGKSFTWTGAMGAAMDGATAEMAGAFVAKGAIGVYRIARGVKVAKAAKTAKTAASAIRPATQQPRGGNGVVLRDGQGATAAEMAASVGGPTGGNRQGQAAVRQSLLDEADAAGEPYVCWRCGHTSTNPADMHVGHRNQSTSNGGNLSPVNVCLEGAACNLSAQNRGAPSPGMSCAQRGSCGAPYGR